jgi:tRNA pseudouridine32 synthase/23S rRNA pseudouridine746 synthase
MMEAGVASLSSLANGIAVTTTVDDRVQVIAADAKRETTTSTTTTKSIEKSTSLPADVVSSSSSSSKSTSNIPDNVLRYERQLRKVQADQRSLTPLTAEEHLRILYEDEDIILTNKPPGVLCVPGLHNKPNLLNLVCQHCNLPTTDKKVVSSYIVHRLDMDTSGLVLFAKTPLALKNLHAAFRDRQVDKEYHALLCGHLPSSWWDNNNNNNNNGGDIHLPLQRDHAHPPFMRIATPRSEEEAARAVKDINTHGFRKLVKKKPKPSHTEFRVLARETLSLSLDGEQLELPVTRVLLIPHTGRTHQLRVHCAALGYPIVGDPAYGLYGEANPRGGLDENDDNGNNNDDDDNNNGGSSLGASFEMQKSLKEVRPPHENPMCLHAARLSLKHPITGERLDWKAASAF